MHELKPLSLVRIEPLEVELTQLEDPYFIPKPFQLTIDAEPGFYLYEMNFLDTAGLPRRLRGIVGKLEINAQSDTFDHLRHTEAETEPHASLYHPGNDKDDPFNDHRDTWGPVWLLIGEDRITSLLNFEGQLVASVTDSNGIHHRMYHIYQSGIIALIEEALSHQPMTIADGHHRLRRAVNGLSTTKKRSPDDRSEVIAFISTIETAEQCIRPIHRCYHLHGDPATFLAQLSEHFRLTEQPLPTLDSAARSFISPTLITKDRAYQIEAVRTEDGIETETTAPDWIASNADSELLSPHLKNLGHHIVYHLTVEDVLRSVAAESSAIGLLCRGVSIERFKSAAENEHLLPPKSILFSPKPLAALMLQESKI
ncbi:MAG: DUF1015 family protein [Acidimicrobiales bacterium]